MFVLSCWRCRGIEEKFGLMLAWECMFLGADLLLCGYFSSFSGGTQGLVWILFFGVLGGRM